MNYDKYRQIKRHFSLTWRVPKIQFLVGMRYLKLKIATVYPYLQIFHVRGISPLVLSLYIRGLLFGFSSSTLHLHTKYLVLTWTDESGRYLP